MSDPYAPSPQPQPQPPFLPYQPQHPPTPPRGNGFGTAGLVLGIISVVLAFIPGLLYLGFVLGTLAIVFGAITLHRRANKGLPATILGSAGVLIAVVFGGLYVLTSTVGSSDAPAPAAQSEGSASSTTAPTEDTEAPADEPALGVGDSAADPAVAGTKFEMTNTNRLDGSTADYTEWVDSYNDDFVSSNEFEQPDANMKYVTVTVHVTATTAGVEAGTLPYDLALSDPSGAVYDSEFISGTSEMPSVTLGAGQSAEGQVVFQVPNEFHGGVLSFGDGSVFVKTN